MKKGIAFFDLDGTITKKDTLLEFIKYSKGIPAFYIGFIICSPYLLAYKLKIISNQKAKEIILSYFFKGTNIKEFQYICDEFAAKKIPYLIKPQALSEIENLKKSNYKIVVVSASLENWIQKWANSLNVEVIATRLIIYNEKLSGKILGKNCYGQEKANRIKEKYSISEYDEILAYGDSKGDIEMLELANKGFMKPFK